MELRKKESQLQDELFIRETMAVPSSSPELLSHQESNLENPESHIHIQIASPRPVEM